MQFQGSSVKEANQIHDKFGTVGKNPIISVEVLKGNFQCNLVQRRSKQANKVGTISKSHTFFSLL